MMMIITGFVNNVQGNQQATGEADRQTKDVEEGKEFIIPDIAPGNLKIISQHGISIITKRYVIFMPDCKELIYNWSCKPTV